MKTEALNLREIFLHDVPLLDVRAPVEFAQGAFPAATNLPILNDEEREQVGICYKEQGPEAAEVLGHQLVSGDVRAQRLATWISYLEANPSAQLYCFRGGKRSQLTESWLAEAGYSIPRIQGGYKRLRQYLLDIYEHLPPVTLLSGRTGTGKTLLLRQLEAMIDLESHANHRGSAFGKHPAGQPSQIDFENAVAIEFLKKNRPLVLEDESRLIGRIHLPLTLQAAMKAAPVVVLEDSLAARVERISQEYIHEQFSILLALTGTAEEAHQRHKAMFLEAIDAIRKRLGGVGHQELRAMVARAFEVNSMQLHCAWIERLLVDYYDPMYDYQLGLKADRVCFRGNTGEVLAFLRDREAQSSPAAID
ncbi:MAG: tRNA 2-selenouridine(34) synthase MnmH [Pseudomonadales bacterium]|nr:tRNA 2-selenouridine(34) synthase MnmH [Pseudomonadales bacterium]